MSRSINLPDPLELDRSLSPLDTLILVRTLPRPTLSGAFIEFKYVQMSSKKYE